MHPFGKIAINVQRVHTMDEGQRKLDLRKNGDKIIIAKIIITAIFQASFQKTLCTVSMATLPE